jgi:hypothetical protein
MAIVKNFLQITGSIKGVSFYTSVGSDKVIMRTKGGIARRRFKMDHGLKNCVNIRLNGRAVSDLHNPCGMLSVKRIACRTST